MILGTLYAIGSTINLMRIRKDLPGKITYYEDFDLLYILERAGWSILYLFYKDNLKEFVISHTFSEPLYDLMNCMISLLNNKNNVSFEFFAEPGSYKWEFVVEKNLKM